MATSAARSRGFTLLEAIIAITVLGVLGGVVAVFIKTPVQAYIDSANRSLLADTGDGAMRRIARDVAGALPNSLRGIAGAGSASCFEFLPVVAGGRYRYQASAGGGGDILDFSTADASFDVLGQMRLDHLPAGTNLVAIANFGIAGADAYAGDNTAGIASVDLVTTPSIPKITLSAAKKFPYESPGRAFQVIPNYSVAYSCAAGKLYRATQAISGSKLAACPTSGAVLASAVSDCNFYYLPAVNSRDGILSITLALTANGETVTLYDQVMVNNVP